jgi:hypothetical protein
MPSEWATVAAAAIGAFAGIGAGVILEMFKRRRDRIGTTSALIGAIRASVLEVEAADLVAVLQRMAAACDAAPQEKFNGSLFTPAPFKPNMMVFEKHIDKLGLIDPNLSERVILWFSTYSGMQHIIWQTLQKIERNEEAGAVIRKGLEAWATSAKEAPSLVTDLKRSIR